MLSGPNGPVHTVSTVPSPQRAQKTTGTPRDQKGHYAPTHAKYLLSYSQSKSARFQMQACWCTLGQEECERLQAVGASEQDDPQNTFAGLKEQKKLEIKHRNKSVGF